MSLLSCTVVLALVVAAVAVALPDYPKPIVPIKKDDRTQNGYGGYTVQVETGDGITREEMGSENDGQNTRGHWKYPAPDGTEVEITFVADQGGYQPQGAVLPVPPPLPYQRTDH